MFDRQIQVRVAKAAPFLSLDADPYAALVNGHIDYIQDAYTTTDNYPYAQNADTSALSSASGLPASFNYIRNSVKVVTDAYTGMMTFYVMDPNDPIIRTYERAFPNMFTPASKMSKALRAHIRYPEDIFTVQASMYGKYHITNATSFYSAADAWTLSPTPGSGSPSSALATTQTLNAQGQPVSTGQLVRMAPIYQMLQVPGETKQTFTLLDALVPVSKGSQIQTLSGFMIAGSDPGQYGKIKMFVTPRGQPVDGPSLVAARIDATQSISKQISLLNQNGSSVELGNVLMIPIADSLLYIQPLYVQSSRNTVPRAAGRDRRVRQAGRSGYGRTEQRRPTGTAGCPDPGVPGAGVDVARRWERDPVPAGAEPPPRRPAGLPAVPDRPEGRGPGRLPDRHLPDGVGPERHPAADGYGDTREHPLDEHHDDHPELGARREDDHHDHPQGLDDDHHRPEVQDQDEPDALDRPGIGPAWSGCPPGPDGPGWPAGSARLRCPGAARTPANRW